VDDLQANALVPVEEAGSFVVLAHTLLVLAAQ
jgi:hypothetical protein